MMLSMPRRYEVEIEPVKTQRDYRRALTRIESLLDAPPDSAEERELDVLATFVEADERRHLPVPDAHPLEVIRFVMDQNGMIDKDLMPFMGTSGRVSEVMSGRRPLTIGMIRKLHHGLGIPADALIADYDVA